MKLKSFTAQNAALAMEELRGTLGQDAVVVSSRRDPQSREVTLTAAVEEAKEPAPPALISTTNEPGSDIWHELTGGEPSDPISSPVLDEIGRVLDHHGVPPALGENIRSKARAIVSADGRHNAHVVLAAALDLCFRFDPLPTNRNPRPIMLVGPPGSGKSVAAVKLVTRSIIARCRPTLIATDTTRSGNSEQLRTYTDVLRIPLHITSDPASLRRIVVGCLSGRDLVVIDSIGIRPFDRAEITRLHTLIEAADAEPVLVLPAGGDPQETIELAEAFHAIGISRLLITRVDTSSRLGGLLGAAVQGFTLTEASDSGNVSDDLWPLSPATLARAMAPEAVQIRDPSRLAENQR